MSRSLLTGTLGTLLVLASPALAQEQPAASELDVAQAYVAAYNARDLDAMMALMHDEVEWLSIDGGTAQVFAAGKPDLAAQMEAYFASPKVTTSAIDGSITEGRFVAVREIARWAAADGRPREQSALAVYEIDAGLVRRVWYYPATQP